MSESNSRTAEELTEIMEARIQTVERTFKNLSSQIVSGMEDMETRIDDLEKNVADLMTQAGMEEQQTGSNSHMNPSQYC
ncbi:heat shock factor-binding protein 1-like protein 1 [Esox lucius]|uniref:Heat shock factor-binding protein 1 n=1 Tax=Esox lucius TaxID=8010 RepID=A0AAY5KRY8_ESOLU|nr:heat shock factor-binding protein 1-like protein 1 [Esox lucius]